MTRKEIEDIIRNVFSDNVTICYAQFVKENFVADMGIDLTKVQYKLELMGYSEEDIRTFKSYLLEKPVKKAVAHFFNDVDIPNNITRQDLQELGDLLKYNSN
jgi:hypothetical protein